MDLKLAKDGAYRVLTIRMSEEEFEQFRIAAVEPAWPADFDRSVCGPFAQRWEVRGSLKTAIDDEPRSLPGVTVTNWNPFLAAVAASSSFFREANEISVSFSEVT